MSSALDRIRGRVKVGERPTGPAPPAARPAPMPAYTEFPVDALPPVLARFVAEVAAAVGCDPALPALPALTVAAAAVGAALVVTPKRGFAEPCSLWCCVVADSGTAKTPAARPAGAAAEAIEDDLEDAHRAAVRDYERRQEAGETSATDRRPAAREYFLVSDLTIERLVENLASSPRGLLVHRDELSGWLASFTRYKSGAGGTDLPNWLSLFDGGSVGYQRRTGVPRDVRVRRGVVSVTGGIQPDILRAALADPAFTTSGLAARLLFAMPPKTCPLWSEAEVDPDTEAAVRQVLNRLRQLPFDPARPGRVALEVAAKAEFVTFSNTCMARAMDLDGGPLAAMWPKLPRHALRLALVHHAVTHAAADADPGRFSVSAESMAAAVRLAGWFGGEAERVYLMMAERAEEADLRRLADLVDRKGGRMTPRDLCRANARKYPNQTAAEAALDALVAAGFGRWEEAKPEGGGWQTNTFVRTTGPADDPGARHS